MLLPLLTFFLITFAVLVERVGFRTTEHISNLTFLPPTGNNIPVSTSIPSSCLIITDGIAGDELNIDQILDNAFTQAKTRCDMVSAHDLTQELINANDRFVITFYDLNLLKETINPLFDKVSNGSGILFAIRPDPSLTFQAIYRKMGINTKADRLESASGVKFNEHLLLGALNNDTTFDFFHHSSLPVQLNSTSKIFLTSADAYEIPLIWRSDLGAGKVVVINSDQFTTPDSVGILFSSYGLLHDVFVYPVINSWTFYLNQFPAPINATQTTAIREEFGRDDRSFFINIWWPDILSLTKKYDSVVTGLSIQSFTDEPKFPYPHEGEEEDYEYLSASIIENNGEVGLIGYNESAYCDVLLNADQLALESNGLSTAVTFMDHILNNAGESLITLAPPTSEDCELVTTLKPLSENLQVLVIRSDAEKTSNEFKNRYIEFPDGTVMISEDTKGYTLTQIEEWRLMNHATLYFAVSSGVTSFDVITSGAPSWSAMRSDLDDQLLWIRSSYPAIRSTTSSDAAKATQRYSRLAPRFYDNGNSLTVEIDGFADEAWLMIITDKEYDSVDGGQLTKVNGSKYLLKAENSVVTINWKE